MASSREISSFLQRELQRRDLAEVSAVDAALWLDEAGLLWDSASRPGKPLRSRLRSGEIVGGEQRPPVANGRWFITRPRRTGERTVDRPGPSAVAESRMEPSPSKDLDTEVERSVAALQHGQRSVELDELPDKPGLYALEARSGETLNALGLKDQPGRTSLAARILYLGKAEDSVRVRLRDGHFAAGKTGHSTVRRTFAALLDFPAIPRPSRVVKPSRKQLMTMTANYALPATEEKELSAWMRDNLRVRAVASTWVPLAQLERAAGAVLSPPLDQERVPFWTPNPWRTDVATARERKRAEARKRVGLA